MSLLGDRHGQIGKLEIMDSDVYLVAKKNSTKRIDLYSKDRKIVWVLVGINEGYHA